MMTKVFIRNPYNYDMDKVSDETGLKCEDPSLTQQHMRDECDINVIVERFGVTGRVPVTPLEPSYGDFSGVGDYHTALNKINATKEQFMTLPAKVRARFDHDPYELVNFLMDEANRSEAIELGLINGEYVAKVATVGVSTETAPTVLPKDPT
jgi:phage internal scaffolding protein